MAEEDEGGFEFSTYIIGAIAITVVMLLLLPMLFVIGKSTAYSAYEQEELYQISDMRESLGSDGEGYFIANTMSTPMLVNDWKDPHRTMLLIIAPEKPIDETEADAIYDFVTEKGQSDCSRRRNQRQSVGCQIRSYLLWIPSTR